MLSFSSRTKSFLESSVWARICIWVLAAGVLLMVVAAVVPLVVLPPSVIEQDPTMRLIFLFVGAVGILSFIAGIIMLLRTKAQRKSKLRLKETGERVVAEITNGAEISKSMKLHSYVRLECTYSIGGKPYIFKSDLLRMDPMPYLPDGRVTVYYDRDSVSHYFVDINGSVNVTIL